MAECRGECGKRIFRVKPINVRKDPKKKDAENRKAMKDNTKIKKTDKECPDLNMSEVMKAVAQKLEEKTNKKIPVCKEDVCLCAKYKNPPFTEPVKTKLKNFAIEKTFGKGKEKRVCGYKISGCVMVSSAPTGVCQTRVASGVVELKG